MLAIKVRNMTVQKDIFLSDGVTETSKIQSLYYVNLVGLRGRLLQIFPQVFAKNLREKVSISKVASNGA